MTEEKDKSAEFDAEDEITQASPDEEVAEEIQKGKTDRIETLEAKAKETENKYLRAVADLENYRKRVQKEKDEVVQAVTDRLLKDFLEVKDHLELALSHSQGATDVKSLREGVTLTLKQLGNLLKKYGVEEIQALGELFDPAYHEAIHQEESAEYKPGAVVHVYQKGYLVKERLLRPARVTVAAEGSGKDLKERK